MHVRSLLVFTTLCLGLHAPSQEPNPSSDWAQEPTIFVGIKLGQPLSTSLPECVDRRMHPDTRPCYKPPQVYGNQIISPDVRNLPAFSSVNVSLVNGKVEDISLIHYGAESGSLLGSMLQQFGPPHSHTSEPVQTVGGAQFSEDHYKWVGKNVTLTYVTNVGKIGDDMIEARTVAFDAYAKIQLENAKKTNIF